MSLLFFFAMFSSVLPFLSVLFCSVLFCSVLFSFLSEEDSSFSDKVFSTSLGYYYLRSGVVHRRKRVLTDRVRGQSWRKAGVIWCWHHSGRHFRSRLVDFLDIFASHFHSQRQARGGGINPFALHDFEGSVSLLLGVEFHKSNRLSFRLLWDRTSFEAFSKEKHVFEFSFTTINW
eukprot:Lithocolla_globosa_v1_NODE_10177_length_627_cov_28.510490.p1 type:complete len:175 gc:universal NODE_10177_length_627_cov_28.510490:9-533(+)